MTYRICLQLLFIVLLSASSVLWSGVHVQDNANLLLSTTRDEVEMLSHDLQVDLGTVFLLRTEKSEDLKNFEEAARIAFSEFIRRVPSDRGILIFIQVDAQGVSGKINFSSGYGLKGALDETRVREIIRNKVLQFSENLTEQGGLIEGIQELFVQLREFHADSKLGIDEKQGSPSTTGLGISRAHLFKILIFLFLAFLIVAVWYSISKNKCPRCGHKIHVSIRPLYKSESPYKRIKIIKCFDCNYFRKYLF